MDFPSIPNSYPITRICVVNNKAKCPAGFTCMDKTQDGGQDADIYRDGFFGRPVTRYICYTRVWPLDNTNDVLTEIAVTEVDVPKGFKPIELTSDTNEKVMKKKVISVKMAPRNSVREAVCELQLLGKQKRAPADFTMVTEMNNLILCYKRSPVPPEKLRPAPNPSYQQPLPYPVNNNVPPPFAVCPPGPGAPKHPTHPPPPPPPSSVPSKVMSHIHGIDFQLAPALVGVGQAAQMSAPEYTYKSFEQINSEYRYDFSSEQKSARRS